MPRAGIHCFATQGSGSHDEDRVRSLLEDLDPVVIPFDRTSKRRSAIKVFSHLRRSRPAVVVMEGTGIAGGLTLIAARLALGVQYVVSSGDAVAPFVGSVEPRLRGAATLYERALYRLSAGFIGWTPYLVGRALTFGAPRGMTAPGWAPHAAAGDRDAARAELGIRDDDIVFGIVGSLAWSRRAGYCYGLELVRAARRVQRDDLRVLVVGGGDGMERLQAEAGPDLGQRVILTGQVPRPELPRMLACMDVASLPQTVDGVGSFRYTTKLSEYLAAGLPVVTSRIPAAYDLDDGWLWRLAGDAPWEDPYVGALAALMERVDREEIAQRAGSVRAGATRFDRSRQVGAVTAFLQELAET